MKQEALPALLQPGQRALNHIKHVFCLEKELSSDAIRNYYSDKRQFAAWCEARSQEGREDTSHFTLAVVEMPTTTAYWIYLQHTLLLKSASVNRSLVRLMGYFIKKCAERAKVCNASLHDLRHRFGYRMAKSIPLHQLAQLMGYNSLNTITINIQARRSNL